MRDKVQKWLRILAIRIRLDWMLRNIFMPIMWSLFNEKKQRRISFSLS